MELAVAHPAFAMYTEGASTQDLLVHAVVKLYRKFKDREDEGAAEPPRGGTSSTAQDSALIAACPLRQAFELAIDKGADASPHHRGLVQLLASACLRGPVGILSCHASILDGAYDELASLDASPDGEEGSTDGPVEFIKGLLSRVSQAGGASLLASQRKASSAIRKAMLDSNRKNPFFFRDLQLKDGQAPLKVKACATAKGGSTIKVGNWDELGAGVDKTAYVERLTDVLKYTPPEGRVYAKNELKSFIYWTWDGKALPRVVVDRIHAANFQPHQAYMSATGPKPVDLRALVMESKRLALSGTSVESMTFALFRACVAAWNKGLTCKHTSCSRLDLDIPDPTERDSFHTLSSSQLRNLAPMLAGAWLFLRVEQWNTPRLAWVVSTMDLPTGDEVREWAALVPGQAAAAPHQPHGGDASPRGWAGGVQRVGGTRRQRTQGSDDPNTRATRARTSS